MFPYGITAMAYTEPTPINAQQHLSLAERVARAKRKPQRLSVTINPAILERLQDRADTEGRSLSNLAAYLLEAAMQGPSR